MKRQSPLRIEANADGAMATMYLYDEIGPSYYGMIDAASVCAGLAQFNGLPVNLRINSPGGDVFEAMAIYNALTRHNATVTTDVDGLAASSASVVMMAGSTVRVAENAMVMIHNPYAVTMGDGDELRKMADMLDQVRDLIADVYATGTGLPLETIKPMMDAETWMRADEAVAKGFCHEVGQRMSVEANVGRLKVKNLPRELAHSSPHAPREESPSKAALSRLVELVAARNRTQRHRSQL